jgi:hypothetical protein
MTFEGALSLLLRYGEYEVDVCDLPDETKQYIAEAEGYMVTEESSEKVPEKTVADMAAEEGWDPIEFDSYEEYQKVNQYYGDCGPGYDEKIFNSLPRDFATREEYHDFLNKALASKEITDEEWYGDEEEWDEDIWDMERYYDCGEIAGHVLAEFDDILEKYGLWYDLCFSWCLTTYRVS